MASDGERSVIPQGVHRVHTRGADCRHCRGGQSDQRDAGGSSDNDAGVDPLHAKQQRTCQTAESYRRKDANRQSRR